MDNDALGTEVLVRQHEVCSTGVAQFNVGDDGTCGVGAKLPRCFDARQIVGARRAAQPASP